jgi:hypothetical protein
MYPNVRFYDFINGSPVRITLQPGKSLSHSEFQPTDEGYSRISNTWTHMGERVYCETHTDSRDCDGRYSSDVLSVFNISEAAAGFHDVEAGVRLPKWVNVDARQRDYTAESMNY